jgi:hypothetical protein
MFERKCSTKENVPKENVQRKCSKENVPPYFEGCVAFSKISSQRRGLVSAGKS